MGSDDAEKRMTLRWGAVALLVLMATGCATSRVVRLDTGEGRPVIYTPRADAEPVELDEDAFAEAVQKLARTAPLSSRPRAAARRLFNLGPPRASSAVRGRLGRVSVEEPQRGRLLVTEEPGAEAELASAYGRWCQVWSLVQGWRVLAKEVEAATTFDEIQDAGEKYGKVMGQNAARAFVMLAMAALGSTAQTLATRGPTLPGSAQALLVGAGQGGFRLAAAGQVTSVAVAPGGVITIALDPEAVAETARGTRALASEPVATRATKGPTRRSIMNRSTSD
jgi:hypothetical protein